MVRQCATGPPGSRLGQGLVTAFHTKSKDSKHTKKQSRIIITTSEKLLHNRQPCRLIVRRPVPHAIQYHTPSSTIRRPVPYAVQYRTPSSTIRRPARYPACAIQYDTPSRKIPSVRHPVPHAVPQDTQRAQRAPHTMAHAEGSQQTRLNLIPA
eukprot:365711-Chlamydomonas_euryale.AAC.6